MFVSIGERLRKLARELGGVGSRQGEDTFLVYCPHQEDYSVFLNRLSHDLFWDDSRAEQVWMRMCLNSCVDKKMEIERRFECAKYAADSADNENGNTIRIYDGDYSATSAHELMYVQHKVSSVLHSLIGDQHITLIRLGDDCSNQRTVSMGRICAAFRLYH